MCVMCHGGCDTCVMLEVTCLILDVTCVIVGCDMCHVAM